MVVDISDEVCLDDALVLNYLEKLFQSVRRQILHLRLNPVQLHDVVVGLLVATQGVVIALLFLTTSVDLSSDLPLVGLSAYVRFKKWMYMLPSTESTGKAKSPCPRR